jgi:hypothetical protein
MQMLLLNNSLLLMLAIGKTRDWLSECRSLIWEIG